MIEKNKLNSNCFEFGNTDKSVVLKKMAFREISLYVKSCYQYDNSFPFICISIDTRKSIIRYDNKIAIKDKTGKIIVSSKRWYNNGNLFWNIGDANGNLVVNGIEKIRLYDKVSFEVDDLIIDISPEELYPKYWKIRNWQESIYRKMSLLEDF